MAHHVAVFEPDQTHSVDVSDHPEGLDEPAHPARREVVLGDVSGHHGARPVAHAGQEHLHLFRGGVLGLVENDESVVERPSPHEGDRGDLDHPPLPEPLRLLGVHHVVERVVERAKIRVHLVDDVAGKEAQLLAGLHRRPGEHNAPHLLIPEGLHRHRHREPGLARSGRSDPEDEILGAESPDVLQLAKAPRPHDLAQRGRDDGFHEVLAK